MQPQARTISEKKFTVTFLNSASGQDVTVDIFDNLDDWWGWGVDRLARSMYGHTGPVKVRVNSYGGDLMQGLAIMNFLQSHPGDVTVEVMGVAASAATFIVAGADRAIMREGSFLMVHNPFTYAIGDAEELDKSSDALRKMESEMANVYLSAMKRRKDVKNDTEALAQIRAWMDNETWFTPSEALENGFIDEVAGAASDTDAAIQSAAPTFQNFQNQYRNTPQRVLNLTHTHKPADTMSKEKEPGLLEQIKALLNPPKAEEKTTDLEAAKKALEEAGYSVTETVTETPETVTETPETVTNTPPAENKAKAYTEEEIEAMIQKRIEAAAAKNAAAQNPTASNGGAKPQSKAEALRAKAIPAFDNLAKLVQGR